MSKMIYICAPLGGNIEANVVRVVKSVYRLSLEYRQNGHASMPTFVVPHLALNGITFTFDGEIDRGWGMECCKGLLRMCDEVVVFGGTITAGMAEELELAHRMEIKMIRREDL